MKNKNFGRKRQAIYILSNRKSTRIIKTLMDFFFFIKVKIKMVCFSVPSSVSAGTFLHILSIFLPLSFFWKNHRAVSFPVSLSFVHDSSRSTQDIGTFHAPDTDDMLKVLSCLSLFGSGSYPYHMDRSL